MCAIAINNGRHCPLYCWLVNLHCLGSRSGVIVSEHLQGQQCKGQGHGQVNLVLGQCNELCWENQTRGQGIMLI